MNLEQIRQRAEAAYDSTNWDLNRLRSRYGENDAQLFRHAREDILALCQRVEELERLGNRAYQIIDFVRDKVAYHFSLDMGLRMNLICEALHEALPEQLPEQETP